MEPIGRCNTCRRIPHKDDLYLELSAKEFICDTPCLDNLFVGESGMRKSQVSSKPAKGTPPAWSGKDWQL